MKASARSLKEKTAFDGWLTKQGGKGLGVNWRRRWFILTYDKYLYYYKSPDVSQIQQLKKISLLMKYYFGY